MDVSEYKSIIEEHQKQMAINKDVLDRFKNRFDSKIKNVNIYPIWAVGFL